MIALLLALAPQASPAPLFVPRSGSFPLGVRRAAGRAGDQLLLDGDVLTSARLTVFELDPLTGAVQGSALQGADASGPIVGVLDVDGDGRQDVVQPDRVLFDETPLGFAAPSTAAVDLPRISANLRAVARTVDLDGNGLGDIVLFHPDGLEPAQAVYGIGHRTFSGAVQLSGVGSPSAAELFDADGDGDLDLVAVTAQGALEIRENDGGPFPWPVAWSEDIGATGHPIVVLADDLDGDGANDLLVGRSELRVHLGGANGFATTAVVAGAEVGTRAWLVDVDGDGDDDLLTGGSAGSMLRTTWLERTGPATFAGSPVDLVGGSGISGPALADLDGDGSLEVYGRVAGVDGIGAVDLPLATPGSTTRRVTLGPFADGIALGDFDGDGDVDLATTAGGVGPVFHERVARRRWRLADPLVPIGLAGLRQEIVALGGAGPSPDAVVVLDPFGDVILRRDPLATTPAPLPLLGSGYSVSNARPCAVDVEGDGDDDVVLVRADGSGLDWIEQTSPFVFAPPASLVEATPGNAVSRFFVRDFDLDGDVDVVTQEQLFAQALARTYTRSGPSLTAAPAVPVQGGIIGVESVRAGGLDVLVANRSAGRLEVTGFQVDAAGGLASPVLWAKDDAADVVSSYAVVPADPIGASAQIYALYTTSNGEPHRLVLFVPGAMASVPVELPSPGLTELRIADLDRNGPELVLFGDEVWTQRPVFGVDRTGSATPFCFEQTRGTSGRAAQLDVTSVRSSVGPTFPLARLRFDLFDLPPQRTVLLLASRSPGFVAAPGGALGSLCLGAPFGRLLGPGQVLTTSARGTASLDLDTFSLPLGGSLVPATPGDQWFFQAWYRDVQSGAPASRFTNGVSARL
ncbi:MAG: FG-GAP-like repeat-containing protein [Planctomycetota bacterium]